MSNQKPLILAIDDNPANLLTLGRALALDFDLQIATSGAIGLKLASQSQPDLILLDIMMPDMDGFETCRRLKANPALKDVPLIFVSALTAMESESRGLALGAADYITKPVNVEIARQRIGNLIEREALRKDVIAQKEQLEAHVFELNQAQQVLKQTQVTLAQSEAFKCTILNSLTEAIAVVDKDGVILAVNERWENRSHDEASQDDKLVDRIEVGDNYLEICRKTMHSDAPDATIATDMLRGIQAVLKGSVPGFSMEYACHLPTQPRWFKMLASPLQQSALGGAVIAHTDISERKAMEAQVRQLAFYDELTGLPNRRLMGDRLRQTMATSKRSGLCGAVMFLDLDNFKSLNDLHGHGVGDLLLVEVASRLVACVREVDTVARFGGDEFVILLGELDVSPKVSTEQALGVAEKIRARLEAPYLLQHLKADNSPQCMVEHHCSVSIGAVVLSRDHSNPDEILKWADSAMYRAKGAGRNVVRFHESTLAYGATLSPA